jgi:hypothetical protein
MAQSERLAFAPISESAVRPAGFSPRTAEVRGRPGIGPARGVFFALAFGTLGWLAILGLVFLVREIL